MSKKEKCTFEEKIKAVEDYLNGKRNQKQIAVDLGLGKRGRSTVGLWVRKYQEAGLSALLPSRSKNFYSKEFKEQVVRKYLNGEGSMQALAIKYGIPNHTTVRDWISLYNSHKKLKSTSVASEVYMAESKRKISLEERLEIVQYCMEHDLDYAQTASRYGLAYWQVYSWVKKYNVEGEEGLSDKRGRRKTVDEIDKSIFLNLDELCGTAVSTVATPGATVADSRPVAMEKLVHELISDRPLTLSRYIMLDSATMTIQIDQTSLSADGYHVLTH